MSPPETQAPSDREQRILEIIETARAKRPRFKDERITMAHGAGGKSTQTLIEGLFAPAFESAALDELGDAGALERRRGRAGADHGHVRRSGRCASPAARSASWPSTGPSTTSRSPARGRSRSASRWCSRRVWTPTCCEPRSRRSPPPRPPPGSRCHRRHEGGRARPRRRDVRLHQRGRPSRDPRAALPTGSLQPGDRVLVSRTIGEHGTAIMLARGELGLDADVVSDTRSLWPAVDALLDAAGPALRTMRDATRGGVATVLNELARASGGRDHRSRGRRSR